MKKLKVIGYLALEKVGDSIVVYSERIFSSLNEAKKFIQHTKETKTIKELLSNVEPIFVLQKLVNRVKYAKDIKMKYKFKNKIVDYFKSLNYETKEFLETFFEVSTYYSFKLFTVRQQNIVFNY